MTARDKILGRIREGKPASEPRPEIRKYSFPGDPESNFRKKLEFFHGECRDFANRQEALAWLRDHLDETTKIYSNVSDFPASYSKDDFRDPRQAHVLDSAVMESRLGVGETGSVWLTEECMGVPAAALLCRDLYVLLDRADIVDGISEAYSRIDLESTGYGSFFTGPSATADIEAVHITGAQGEISLTVLLY